MNVVVVLDHCYVRSPEGLIWTSGDLPYPFFKRYLGTFDHVRVLARVRQGPKPLHAQLAEGEGVSLIPLPHGVGPWKYLLRARETFRVVSRELRQPHAVILRVPSQTAFAPARELRSTGCPFGLEVVGDPYDAYAPGSKTHPLRPLLRWWHRRNLRDQCLSAAAVAYVTKSALQRRYPPAEGAYVTNYSSIELHDEDFVAQPRLQPVQSNPLQLVCVGSLDHLHKGPDILLEAAAVAVGEGLDVRVKFLGDGRYRPHLEGQAAALGIQDHVDFRGHVINGDCVSAELDQADVFVLPSRQEGLPRAMIEAMARGLPCLGTSVGGVPELLPPEDLVEPSNSRALAQKILEVARDSDRLAAMSRRNLKKAYEYRESQLRRRRDQFYRYVRDRTAEWLKQARRVQLSGSAL